MPLAQLDLGELGEQIDAALQDADLDEIEAAAPDGQSEPVEPAGDGEGEVSTPGDEHEPAADAGDDFEARFKDRFEQEYAERSRRDISRLQSRLDRQIRDLRESNEDLEDRAGEGEHAVQFLLKQLREYDPEAADRFERSRQPIQQQIQKDRKLARIERREADETRASWYAAAFPDGEVAADDPELLDALKQGKDFEGRLLKIKVRELGLVYDEAQGRFVKAGSPAPARQEPAAPKQEPARNDKGQLVSQQVAATRQREQERGKPVILTRTGAGGDDPRAKTDIKVASANLNRELKAMGLG